MHSLTKTYSITEYGGFTRGSLPFSGYQPLPEHTFDALESFMLANHSENNTDAVELLSLSVRRGIGKIITARNYVGLISMKDGTTIEILPKLYGSGTSELDTRRIFLDMLKTLKDVSFKEFNISSLKTDRLNLFEIFISMFATEAATLVKQGLKSSYNPVEANERFFKGKLNVPENIKHNYVNKEKFFVKYDEWSVNRPENRLFKATLRFLQKQTRDDRNRLNISRLLTFFDGVESSADFEADFSKCTNDRSMSHYEKALSWCRVFLRGNSFTAFAGSEVAIALLFPMEKVFESFVADKFRKHIGNGINLRTQDTRFSLFDSPTKAFALRPDIVLEIGGRTVVLDTKWKILSDNAKNHGISQTDMYQMYAYSKKYDADHIILLYPHSDSISISHIGYSSDDHVKVDVSFIDLRNAENSITKILSEVC